MIFRLVSSIILMVLITPVFGQEFSPKLSPKHIDAIEKTKDAAGKLKRYRKYYHRDSVRQAKLMDRYWDALSDSMTEHHAGVDVSQKSQHSASKLRDIRTKLSGYGIRPGNNHSSTLTEKLNSAGNLAEGIQGESLTGRKQELMNGVNSPADKKNPAEALQGEQKLRENFAEVDAYKTQANEILDSVAVKEAARKKAEELAMKYVSENPAVLNGAKVKLNALMKKYSVVPNSNDLSSAVKRTSLAGKPFRERLVLGLNFTVPSVDPLSIDFAPAVGYRINRRFIVGTGITYRQSFHRDSSVTIAPHVFGYKAFSSYEVVHGIFAYVEYARNTIPVGKKEGSESRRWQQAFMVGAGKRFAVHPKVDMVMIAVYNLMTANNDPVYPRRFMIKVGFQLSELALIKK